MFEFNKDYSAYPNAAGTELYWLPNDTQELFKQHCKNKKTKALLKEAGWRTTNLTYKFNSHGFRCEEFVEDAGSSIMFLGCSHTLGIGIPYEHTFAYHVAQELNLRNYNLSIGAGSNDSAFRFGSYWIPKLLPKIVVLVRPEITRSEVLSANFRRAFAFGVFTQDKEYLPYVNLVLANSENAKLNQEKNVLALTYICNGLSIPIVVADQQDINLDGKARDLGHAGPVANKQFAEQLLPKIKSKLEDK